MGELKGRATKGERIMVMEELLRWRLEEVEKGHSKTLVRSENHDSSLVGPSLNAF